VCTTIDQLGSRLLFRGYGVSTNAAPMQASLVAYDSLVLLDEAHISRPFLQTLNYVKRYLDPEKWAEQPVGVKPMIVVPMTATPPEDVPSDQMFALPESDKQGRLKARLEASKKATLRSVPDVVKAAVDSATALSRTGPTAVGIMVNRVATAKAISEKLREQYSDKLDVVVELVIGSMRPIDRDRQAERLRELVGPGRPERSEKTSFIVATQCLEVGADYDFDALVTECASLDALRQRFGRLNRGGRPIEAKAVILMSQDAINPRKPDPIYAEALPATWNWLWANAEVITPEAEPTGAKKRGKKQSASEERVIDFGINAFKPKWDSLEKDDRQKLSAPSASKNAPVMLPAYVDFWCQTSPRPTPDPEVSLFIHGPEAGEPDVQVCWRADLEEAYFKKDDWCNVVALLPPTSAECMSVPISRLRKWLTEEDAEPEGDLLGTATDDTKGQDSKPRNKTVSDGRVGVLWRGSKESQRIRSVDELRPGDTLVLPALAGGWSELGHVPEATVETIDVAETAFQTARDRAVLRLHPALKAMQQQRWPNRPWEQIDEFFARLIDLEDPPSEPEVRQRLKRIAEGWPDFGDRKFLFEYYRDERGVVLITRKRLGQATEWFTTSDEGEDERSQTLREEAVSLNDHTRHVRGETVRTVDALPIADVKEAYRLAADWHDLGKADERFQAMLRRTDRTDAWLLSGLDTALLAKSDGLPQTPQQRQQARERAGLPEGFRHEMVSVQIVEHSQLLEEAREHRDLILHLIAAHHGYARPFAPVVIDPEYPEVTVEGITLTGDQRKACPPHRIDSGIAERFWELTRRYGWWGLAYLETVLRLADQQASADEDEGLLESATASAKLAEASS